MQKTMKYSLIAGILLTLTVAGVWATTSNASAQAVSGSFNPQTQFPVGSTVTITSVYGIATVPAHPFNASSMPGLGNRNWNQTNKNHNWNQTIRNHKNLNQTTINHNSNQTFMHPWNGTAQQYVKTYSTSVTISAQVANDTANGGIQWTIQSGSIVVNGNTFTITGGKGQMSSLGRLVIGGTATDSNGNTLRWQLQGLAAMYNGTVIADLNGGSFTTANNPLAHANLTYLATIS
ncbi:MAG: hypothetical protein ABSE39_03175 [Candidatus Bathyarchaeia archaeon]|jgi:hypothetical protein